LISQSLYQGMSARSLTWRVMPNFTASFDWNWKLFLTQSNISLIADGTVRFILSHEAVSISNADINSMNF